MVVFDSENSQPSKISYRTKKDGTKVRVIQKKVRKTIKLKKKISPAKSSSESLAKPLLKQPAAQVAAAPSQTKAKAPLEKVDARATKKTAKGNEILKNRILIVKRKKMDWSERVSKNSFSSASRRGGRKRGPVEADKQWQGKEQEGNLQANLKKRKPEDEFAKVPKQIEIPDVISIRNLAQRLKLRTSQVIKKLISLGEANLTVNDSLDGESAQIVCQELGCEATIVSLLEQTKVEEEVGDKADYEPRPPVVTVMGHVDHGKTTLLDTIRKTKVAAQESGNITQHVSAYEVNSKNGKILFIDTPGHSAFSALRARGAKITDLIVLVVDANESLKPQALEVIKHAKAAKVPVLVALNKIDLPTADPEKLTYELANYGLVSEAAGGDTVFVPISALKNQGIDDLLAAIERLSKKYDFKGNPKLRATGYVIESKIELGKGNTATVVVKNGTLRVSDLYLTDKSTGRVRAMFDEHGKRIKAAPPAKAVEIIGLSELPAAGELFQVLEDERQSRKIVESRVALERENKAASVKKISPQNIFASMERQAVKELNLILKADTYGSIEAIHSSLQALHNEEVKVTIVHQGVGVVNESDLNLALAAKAHLVAFRAKPNGKVAKLAEREKIVLKNYTVLYDLLAQVGEWLTELMGVQTKEQVLGKLVVKELFKVPKFGKIAGCEVLEGKVVREASVRLVRPEAGPQVVFTGPIASLKRFKDEVKEVAGGNECGVALQGFQEMKVGDQLEVFSVETIKRIFEVKAPVTPPV